jgi:hypothetical protein
VDYVICQDTLYIIAGLPAIMIGIDQVNELWQNKMASVVHTDNGIAFSLDKKIYYGNIRIYSSSNGEFYEIDPSKGYLTTVSTNFPTVNTNVTTYFSIGNKGYVLFSNNSFWQFDSENKSWTRLADFSGPARYLATSFVIGGFGYIGSGINNDTIFGDIWRYNPINDSWSFISSMPNPRYRAVALTINNKAYIGYGIYEDPKYNYIDLYDFYEFDPNYPLK